MMTRVASRSSNCELPMVIPIGRNADGLNNVVRKIATNNAYIAEEKRFSTRDGDDGTRWGPAAL
jgi:hypothetical protein